MMPKTAMVVILFFFLQSALFGQSKQDKWPGTYKNPTSGVQLIITPKTDGMFLGNFRLQDQSFPIRGLPILGLFSGEYQHQGNWFPFTLAHDGDTYLLTADGVTAEMQKFTTGPTPTGPSLHNGNNDSKTTPPVAASKGKRMTDPYGGYSFNLPEGWACNEQQGNFILTRTGETVQLAVGTHNVKSVQEALSEPANPITDEKSNTYLVPSAKAYGNNGLQLTISGQAQGEPLSIETISIVSPYGGGASFAAVLKGKSDASAYLPILQAMAASVQFTRPTQSEEAKAWQQRIAGRQLHYLKTDGGGSTSIKVKLFADGRYSYRYSSSYYSGGISEFSYADRNNDEGTWKIVSRGKQVVLLTFSQDGSTGEYLLQQGQNQGELISNGRRYFITGID